MLEHLLHPLVLILGELLFYLGVKQFLKLVHYVSLELPLLVTYLLALVVDAGQFKKLNNMEILTRAGHTLLVYLDTHIWVSLFEPASSINILLVLVTLTFTVFVVFLRTVGQVFLSLIRFAIDSIKSDILFVKFILLV